MHDAIPAHESELHVGRRRMHDDSEAAAGAPSGLRRRQLLPRPRAVADPAPFGATSPTDTNARAGRSGRRGSCPPSAPASGVAAIEAPAAVKARTIGLFAESRT